jgi:DNA-binding response OmpR family regulator
VIAKPRILIVEDQDSERNALERVLRVAQYDVVTAANAEEPSISAIRQSTWSSAICGWAGGAASTS